MAALYMKSTRLLNAVSLNRENRRTVAGPVLAVILGTAFYLPRRGEAALDENFKEYQQCEKVIIEWAPTPSGAFPTNGCFERYMERREQILWRCFFVQTVVTHL